MVIALASLLLYLPINRLVSQGYNLELPIDKSIPLLSLFVVPYLIGIIFWPVSIFFINLKHSGKIAFSFNRQIIIANVTASIIYLTVPTLVSRPVIVNSDIFSNLLNWLYTNDRVYNAAPSGHTFNTLICCWALNKIYPKYTLVWFAIAALIIISTLFTKQHNILDVLLGIVFALVIKFALEKFLKNPKIN